MKLSSYSRNRILTTMKHWHLPKEFADPFYNYMVFGFKPGGCYTAMLANDFFSAIGSSHPSNQLESYKALVGWIRDTLPQRCFGSYEAVEDWVNLSEEKRQEVLFMHGLIFSPKEETWLAIKGEYNEEPVLY